MAVSALLLVLVMVVIAVALLAILPRAWENASPSPAVVQPPTNMAQFQQSERPIDVTPIPREEPPMELIPPEDLIVQPPAQPPTQPPATSPVERPADTRERGIFLIQMENEGADLQLTRVNRTLSASETPLIDTLNALFLGPTAEESARGIISFIPPNSQILSVRVEGHTVGNARRDTAYINFNESFQFTPYGREGLRYQIWQIVYTATEFPNVHDVQILIEGNRVDFLHEGGIRIGSPIGR